MRLTTFRLVVSAAAVLIGLLGSQTSHAARVQGFETGDPAVTGVGDAGITAGAVQGEVAPDPTHWYEITTIRATDNEDGVLNQSGSDAVAFATLNNATNFNGGAPTGIDGSGVFIPFTVSAGDTLLSFNYDILSNQPGQTPTRNDFAFVSIYNTSKVQQLSTDTFAHSNDATSLFGAQDPFVFHSGISTKTVSLTTLAPGNYLLGIGIEDQGTLGDHASALLIDNIVTAVPEPSTFGLIVAGAFSLAALRRRLRR